MPSAVASLVTLYLGAVAVALPLGGSIGDRYGHRRAFVVGVIGFAVASALAALGHIVRGAARWRGSPRRRQAR